MNNGKNRYPVLRYIGDVYRPSDDSWLLVELLEDRYPRGDICLDLGSGTGVLGLYASMNNICKKIVFVDLSEDAVESTRINVALNNVKYALILQSDDVSIREGIVDIVLANPPYLPIHDPRSVDIATEGGVIGYETIRYFIEYSSIVLRENGLLFLVYSSLSRPEIVEDFLRRYGFKIKYSKTRHFFYETIFAAECVKTWSRSELSSSG